jgi:cellulose synthase/poly-beta-1,6-N-acetylglucosamine synthase-like glycosyltransferase
VCRGTKLATTLRISPRQQVIQVVVASKKTGAKHRRNITPPNLLITLVLFTLFASSAAFVREASRSQSAIHTVQHASLTENLILPTLAAALSVADDVAVILLICVVTLILAYSARHYIFTLNRLYGRQRHPYVDVREADWPTVTVAIPAHNEEKVITHILSALMVCDYPEDRLEIVVVNDRSTDRTQELIDEMAARYPGRLSTFQRTEGRTGKAAALREALSHVTSDVVLIFDADYLPGRGLIKQLVAPFFDPEVGAVMGRVVPINVETNLLTRLLDLERSGGYQVDQQARMNLGLVPQFGGTVGGLRRVALESVGGWREDSLTEDTDITYRMLLRGWRTAYQNRSECYEEVPNAWPVRVRQINRWARGHNECMRRYSTTLMQNLGWTRWWQRLDGMMLLGVYAMSAVLMVGWMLALALFFAGSRAVPWLYVFLAVAAYSAIGNFAVFFEIAAAARLDGYRNRIRLLPFVFFNFVISVVATARTVLPDHLRIRGRHFVWHKTERSRTEHPVAP